MAKKKTGKINIRLVSSEGTGIFYIKKKNVRAPKKLQLRKYDKKLRKHVLFLEKKDK